VTPQKGTPFTIDATTFPGCPLSAAIGTNVGSAIPNCAFPDITDFSVVLFRPNFMLLSEEHPMKMHNNQWFLTLLSSPDLPCGAMHRGTHHGSGVQTPLQGPDMGRSPEMWDCKLLRIKHFHRVSSGYPHPYLLRSRYGKVSSLILAFWVVKRQLTMH
jgi:hypothetical protein